MPDIDILAESTLGLTAATKLLPPSRGDRPVTLSCILRWVLSGVIGPTGERVRLEAVRLGGRWVTSRESLQRFAEALTPDLSQPRSMPVPASATKRRRRAKAAGAALAKSGI